MELLDIIKNRRSIYPKTYSEEKIDARIINKILEAGNWAPSHRHTRPWSYIVFHGEGLKKLADFQAEYYKNNTTDFKEAQYQKLLNKPLMCSHIIAICMKRDIKKSVPEIEEIEAVACSVQNMHLMASSLGIGAYWGTGGVTYEENAKDFFGLGNEDKLLGFFFLGKPTIDWPKAPERDWKNEIKWVDQ